MNDVLKKCPFCGCNADIIDDEYGFNAYCRDCRGSIRPEFTYEDAVKAWNTRATDKKLAKCVAFIEKIATEDWLDECDNDNAYADISQLSGMAEKLLEEIGE